jgi:muramidase (phage lysozyme)
MRGLLDTISDKESRGNYGVMYGGKETTDFSHHPGMQPGGHSAAGRYQFIKSTWDEDAKALGVKDFSPASQDKVAAYEAAKTYKLKTGGRDLNADLKDPMQQQRIALALNQTWASLPGGPQNPSSMADYQKRLAMHTGQEVALAGPQSVGQGAPMQMASNDQSTTIKGAASLNVHISGNTDGVTTTADTHGDLFGPPRISHAMAG